MREQIVRELIENNVVLKRYLEYPKQELELIRMYLNLELMYVYKDPEENMKVRMIRTCLSEPYNYLDYILSYRYKVDSSFVAMEEPFEALPYQNMCEYCKGKTCIKKSVSTFIHEIDQSNKKQEQKFSYLEVIDYMLRKKPFSFQSVPEKDFFDSVDFIDLMYVQVILEGGFVSFEKLDNDTKKAEFSYLDLTQKSNQEYYSNLLLEYYKNRKNVNHMTLDMNHIEEIYLEKDVFLRRYKIAAYYQYLMEVKGIGILVKLREMLKSENSVEGMKVRSKYFIYRFFQKVENLPYTKKTKDKIYRILNYILNYRYQEGTPFIPINILIYSNDKEGVETICEIIGEFMWFFGYLSENMRYYSEYMNNIILDKYWIKKLYDDEDKKKNGILLLHNFENLLYTDYMQQNLTLNILTDEMEKNNRSVCTIIYGKREMLKQIMGNHLKLSQMLINLELEIDELDIDKIYELVVSKLEKNTNVSDKIKEKLYHYIKATYLQSDMQNMEYVNKLYHQIILNMNNQFSLQKRQKLSIHDIPEAYNTKDLPTIMKDMNALVGLSEIKEQMNDLVALLKFNQKVNIDISQFNLHMIFSGNPGTGKTTVARLVKEIFFNLGYISQNKLTEVTAKDLIAEYLGQTSGKTYNVVKSALGGVLFIDEAYAITSGSGDGAQYGNECIAMLLKLMEDYKDKLIVIFAGYEEEMKNFKDANPGLISRIGYHINFPDYTLEELSQIYLDLLEKSKMKIQEKALEKLKKMIKESSTFEDFGNARYIHTIFQKILIEHAKNVEQSGKKNYLYQITEEDIKYEKLIAENKRKKMGFQ